jgi:hypothetical protein
MIIFLLYILNNQHAFDILKRKQLYCYIDPYTRIHMLDPRISNNNTRIIIIRSSII